MKELLYVANAGEDTISVISTKELRETKRIPLHGELLGPRRLCKSGNSLYFINSYASSVGRIDLATGVQRQIAVGSYPSGLCKIGPHLYVCCGETNNVYRINCGKWRAELCAYSGVFPDSICAAQNGSLVCCLLSCEAIELDQELRKMKSYHFSSMPLDAVQVDGETIFSLLETDGGGCLMKFDAQGGQIEKSIRCPAGRLCPLKQQKRAVAAHLWDNAVSIVDLSTLRIETTVKTAAMPDDVVCDQDRIYVSCMLGDCVDVLENGKRIARIRVGREPRGLALCAQISPFLQLAD